MESRTTRLVRKNRQRKSADRERSGNCARPLGVVGRGARPLLGRHRARATNVRKASTTV